MQAVLYGVVLGVQVYGGLGAVDAADAEAIAAMNQVW